MLKEISMQQLKNKTVMLPEVSLIDHANNIVLVVRIFLHDVF